MLDARCLISIHVPRVEDDKGMATKSLARTNFNPRPPWGGRRRQQFEDVFELDFNPRPPCGGRRAIIKHKGEGGEISIHVPRVEDDPTNSPIDRRKQSFQSTSPVWRTTHIVTVVKIAVFISIHVPRVEDDARCS